MEPLEGGRPGAAAGGVDDASDEMVTHGFCRVISKQGFSDVAVIRKPVADDPGAHYGSLHDVKLAVPESGCRDEELGFDKDPADTAGTVPGHSSWFRWSIRDNRPSPGA